MRGQGKEQSRVVQIRLALKKKKKKRKKKKRKGMKKGETKKGRERRERRERRKGEEDELIVQEKENHKEGNYKGKPL